MSYGFEMCFKEIEKENILDFIMDLTKELIENSYEIMSTNLYYCPTVKVAKDKIPYVEYMSKYKENDRNWLYRLFSIRILYWKDKNLMGIQGELPKKTKEKLKTFYFQNSTDQDYDYEEWKGIQYFENIVNEVKSYKENDLKVLTSFEFNDFNDAAIEYCKKSLIYKKIYEDLELDEWLYHAYEHNGDFELFSINPIVSYEQSIQLSYKMLKILIENEVVDKRKPREV